MPLDFTGPAPIGSTKDLSVTNDSTIEIQLGSSLLLRKNYGSPRKNPYACQQAAILREGSDRFFRGRDSIRSDEENRLFIVCNMKKVDEQWIRIGATRRCTVI